MTFTAMGLHSAIERGVQDAGYTKPTPIQIESIPPAMGGRDILATAMTGSGKTAAFVLPILHRLERRQPGRGPRALILTPTRELASQILVEIERLGARTGIQGAAIYGGVGMMPQEKAFRRGTDIIVATPGRLLDHLQYRYATLDGVRTLVLDEADRMLDMGFLPAIHRVLERVPRDRQTLFFSATMPAPIAKLSAEMLRNPVRIVVEQPSTTATGVRQRVYPVAETLKSKLLLHLLGGDDLRSVLAFTRTKRRADRLAEFLEKNGVAAALIHGNRSQGQRERALDAFKRGKARILVATDIAARGIDIVDLSHVINYDLPNAAEDYVHRVGRTARANKTGDALTFVTPGEEADLRLIEKGLGKRIDREAAPAHLAPARGGAEAAAEERFADRRPVRQPRQPGRGAPSRIPAAPAHRRRRSPTAGPDRGPRRSRANRTRTRG